VGVTDAELAMAEQAYLEARDAIDRATIAAARGDNQSGLDDQATRISAAARTAIAAVHVAHDWADEDRRAYDIMRRWAATAAPPGDTDPIPPAGESWAATAERGYAALAERIEDAYAREQAAVDIGDVTATRTDVLGRLATERDPVRRRTLFGALEPVWASMDADGGVASPYRRLVPLGAQRWATHGSPIAREAAALGLSPDDVEPVLVTILEAWRDAAGNRTVQPWDWWYDAGTAARALDAAAPLDRLLAINEAYYASLGADPRQLGIGFDVTPRPTRPLVPVAYTDFGGRPRRQSDGSWYRARPWVLATYTAGGLAELTELVHETGHAIHIAAIDRRPAFADWPDSDAFTEALAELTALDTAEPAWQQAWLGASVPEDVSLRARYADVMLDICWALFEIRMYADPERIPNDVWTDLTSTYLGIAPHPEWSWWAMRGQLVQSPGYMVTYALGPIIAADLRAAIRSVRGDWAAGDSGWYDWVSARVYRWGSERISRDVITDVLGRPPSAAALLAQIAQVRRP
jgi:hypothetical protein